MHLSPLEHTPQIEYQADAVSELAELTEAVRQRRVLQFSIENAEEVNSLIAPFVEQAVYYDQADRPQQTMVPKATIDHVWQHLLEGDRQYAAVNAQLNVYHPGDSFGQHIDLDGEHSPLEAQPPELLTFLYVVSGEKEIDFYLDGPEDEPSVIHQTPGTLFIFQGGTYLYVDGAPALAVPHAVRPQQTESVTLTWELMPRAE